MTSILFRIFLLALLISEPGASAETQLTPSKIKDIFTRHYPMVVGISSNGDKLLKRSYVDGKFVLSLDSIDNQHSLFINADSHGQFAPKLSRDGRFIYYFLQDLNTQLYQLRLRRLDGFKEDNLQTFPIASPKGELSSDNRYLALVTKSGRLVIIDLNKNLIVFTSSKEVLYSPCFVWSYRSSSIAYILRDSPSQIQTYNADSKTSAVFNLPAKIDVFSWSKKSDLPISATILNGNLSLFEGTTKLTMPPPQKVSGDISSIFTSADENCVVMGNNDGFNRNHILLNRQRMHLTVKPGHPIGISESGDKIYLSDSHQNIAKIRLMPLDSDSRTTLFSRHKGLFDGVSSTEDFINSSHGKIPLLLWRKQGSNRAVLIMLHGGPGLNYSNLLTPEISTLLEGGIDVLRLNFHGSSGYDADFLNQKQYAADDVRLSVQYLRENKSYKRIFIYGESSGTRLALDVTKSSDLPISGVILASYTPPLMGTSPFPQNALVLQGAFDQYCKPSCARSLLMQQWGQDESPWLTIVEREGHIFHSLEARMNTTEKMANFIGAAINH